MSEPTGVLIPLSDEQPLRLMGSGRSVRSETKPACPPSTMLLLAPLFVPLLALFCFCTAAFAVPAAESVPRPRVTISPIIPPGPDDGLDQGIAFADLLAVRLSDDARWELVERARLSLIEGEWAFKGSLAAGRAEALRLGALARADLVVECTVSSSGLEHPWCRLVVVETARAELLAERKILLNARPTGTWYRSPPEADVDAVAAAAREALGEAAERLAGWHDKAVAALVFAPRDQADVASLDGLAATARSAGFRWVDLVPGAAAEAEGLLHLLGYTDATPSPWAKAADVYLWIMPAAEGGKCGPVLHLWRPGLPVRARPLPASEAAAESFAEIMRVIRADLSTAPSAPSPEERLEVARRFLTQARSIWRAAGFSETADLFDVERDFGPPDSITAAQRAQLAVIRDLLAAAAFFALEDSEIQQLRAVLDVAVSDNATKPAMRQRYCAMVDRFWLLPDQRVDWRLYAESFAYLDIWIPAGFQKRRMAAGAEVLLTLPEEFAHPFGPMLDHWLRTILMAPEDKDLALVKRIWPMALRGLGNKIREPGDRGRPALFTRLSPGPDGWRDELDTLLGEAGPALYHPPAPPRFHARAAPSERRGLSVQERTPQVFQTVTKGDSTSTDWQQIEKLDDGRERVRTIPRPEPTPASMPPTAPTPGATPLSPVPVLAAAQGRDWAEVDRLLAAGADLSVDVATSHFHGDAVIRPPARAGQALLGEAVRQGRSELANRLLDSGVKPSNTRSHGVFRSLWTRLGDLSDAELRLYRRLGESGARVPNEDTYDPFIEFFQHQEFLRKSRKRHEEFERKQASPRPPGLVALEEKRKRENEEKSIMALKQLIDLQLEDVFGGPALNRADEDGRTPLVRAILLDWDAGVAALLDAGADLDRGHFEGTPARRLLNANPRLASLAAKARPSSSAAASASEQAAPDGVKQATPGGAELVAALLRGDDAFLAQATLGGDALRYRDVKGWSLLHHAAHEKAEDFARRLIAAGAPLDVLSSGGQTPMAFAAAQRLESLVETMLEAGATVDLRGGQGPTPLFQAAFSQNPSLVRRLLDAGADHRIRAEEEQRTVAHAAACRADNVAVLEVLFSAGADFQALCGGGFTLLDWAFSADAPENVPYLHAKGVRWQKRKARDLTPLQKAAEDGRDRMVRALLDCGEWDEGALTMARSPAVEILLEDAAARRGSKVAEDIAAWPGICADRVNGVRRAEAHLAAGGDVNHARVSTWGRTPLEMALAGMNPDLVRFLLERGAGGRMRRDDVWVSNIAILWSVHAPMWLRHPDHAIGPPPFTTTLEAWDAYAAEMITLVAPRWPDPENSELIEVFEKSGQPRSAAALRAAGVLPP
jgi:ankyrin repeat protein